MLAAPGRPGLAGRGQGFAAASGPTSTTPASPGRPLRRDRGDATDPNHLRAFALIVSMMLGGFSVIPYISPYLVSNVGVSQASLPLVYIAGARLTLVAARRDRQAGRPLRQAPGLPGGGAPVGGADGGGDDPPESPPPPGGLAATAALMVGNAGRMVVAMAMVTSCVEPRRRGSFMSLNSSVQHLSSGVGAALGGAIIGRDRSGGADALRVRRRDRRRRDAVEHLPGRPAPPLHPGTDPWPPPGPCHDLGVDPAPAAALEMPPSAELDVPPSTQGVS